MGICVTIDQTLKHMYTNLHIWIAKMNLQKMAFKLLSLILNEISISIVIQHYWMTKLFHTNEPTTYKIHKF